MRIRFLAPDPRAGMVAQMDSSRGMDFVQSGQAEQVDDHGNAIHPATVNPRLAGGKQLSASPAAPASQQTTARASGGGGKKRKAIPVEPVPSGEQQTSEGVIGECGLELMSEKSPAEELLEEAQAETDQQEVQSELL